MRILMAAALSVLGLGAGPGNEGPRYTAHEWGTFTTVSGADGAALDWRPLAGPSDLPGFVYKENSGRGRLGGGKGVVARVRMETPVIYFYADQEQVVSAKVEFPQGRITEWYPFACEAGKRINWGKFKLVPGLKEEYPREAAESHYYPARETDATPIRIWTRGAPNEPEYQTEKFLFYRGVGRFEVPLRAGLAGGKVRVEPTGPESVTGALLFERKGGRVGWTRLGRIAGRVEVERPALTGSVESIWAELEAMLTREGLFAKEAKAMLKTWRDSWFEEGLRVMYLVPRRSTDAVLPLQLDPKPAELVRVLVGRAELITPEFESKVEALSRRLPAPAAKGELEKLGRFAEPALRRVQQKTVEQGLRDRISAFIAGR
jgi:hypothetical protein